MGRSKKSSMKESAIGAFSPKICCSLWETTLYPAMECFGGCQNCIMVVICTVVFFDGYCPQTIVSRICIAWKTASPDFFLHCDNALCIPISAHPQKVNKVNKVNKELNIQKK